MSSLKSKEKMDKVVKVGGCCEFVNVVKLFAVRDNDNVIKHGNCF